MAVFYMHQNSEKKKPLICAKEVNIYDRKCEGNRNLCTYLNLSTAIRVRCTENHTE